MKLLKTIVIVLLVSLQPTSSALANNADTSAQSQDRFIRMKMREHIGYDPLLEIIAGCESTGNPNTIKHWNADGTLLKNPTSSASGALQILLQFHSEWIESAGMDMGNIDEYMKFAKILFEEQGYDAWYPSRHCWGGYTHLAQN